MSLFAQSASSASTWRRFGFGGGRVALPPRSVQKQRAPSAGVAWATVESDMRQGLTSPLKWRIFAAAALGQT